MGVKKMKEKNEKVLKEYELLSEDIKAEIKDGKIVYLARPSIVHQFISREIVAQLRQYIASKNGECIVLPDIDVMLNANNDDEMCIYAPDVSVICDTTKLIKQRYIGAPDFLIEILSPSNSMSEMIKKVKDYMANGAKECWIVDVANELVQIFLKDPDNVIIMETFSNTIKVNIYDDCYIDFSSVLSSKEYQLIKELK